jgi:hypothetical protein
LAPSFSRRSLRKTNIVLYDASLKRQDTTHCEREADTLSRQKCRETEEGRIFSFLGAMAETIAGKAAFSDTLVGAAAIMSKRILGPQTYERMQREAVPLYKAQLMCP